MTDRSLPLSTVLDLLRSEEAFTEVADRKPGAGEIIEEAAAWLEEKLAYRVAPSETSALSETAIIPEGYVWVEAVAALLDGKKLQWREGPSFDANSYRTADAGSFIRSRLDADSSPR